VDHAQVSDSFVRKRRIHRISWASVGLSKMCLGSVDCQDDNRGAEGSRFFFDLCKQSEAG